MPIVAAGTSAAVGYVVKKAPDFVEETLLPRMRDAAQGAGGVAEKLPDRARSVVSGGGELAEQLAGQVRDATGNGDGDGDARQSGALPGRVVRAERGTSSPRAQRRRATKTK